jgi:hypothetical protein
VKVKKDMISLHEAYERVVSGIGGLYVPINGAASSADDFFCWFESEVALLLEIFVRASENFVSIALEGILQMVKEQNTVDFNVLKLVTSTCRMTLFMSGPHEVKRMVRNIITDWWRPFGFGEALLVTRTKIYDVSSVYLASYF